MTDTNLAQNITGTLQQIGKLIQLKDAVIKMQADQDNKKRAIEIAMQNSKMFRDFYKKVRDQLDLAKVEEIDSIINKVRENEEEISKLIKIAE